MDELDSPAVRMKDRPSVEAKIGKLIKGGKQRLQVITDFDYTLSRSHIDGKRCNSCHDAIDLNERMPHSFRESALRFKQKYWPIAADPELTPEEKTPHMAECIGQNYFTQAVDADDNTEWEAALRQYLFYIRWLKWFELLMETGLKQADLMEMVGESTILLRDECLDFLDVLHRHKVPLVIFSAGLGNILEEAIRQQAFLFDNIKVISNYMVFDDDGILKGLRNDTIIHIFNKNSSAIDVGDSFCDSENRPNVVLLGDSIGDVNMDAGLCNVETILRIGFLNTDPETNLARFLDNYDIVIQNDQTMGLVNTLLERILLANEID